MRGLRSFVLIGLCVPMLVWAEPPRAPAQPAVQADDPIEGAVLVGLGLGYAGLGAQFAARLPHVEPFLGLGLLTLVGGISGGLRIFPMRRSHGLYLSLAGGRLIAGSSHDIPEDVFAEAGLGYRAPVTKSSFVQVGAAFLMFGEKWEGEAFQFTPAADLDVAIGFSF